MGSPVQSVQSAGNAPVVRIVVRIGLGAAIGTAAAWVQLETLRYGAIAADSMPLLFGSFAAAGGLTAWIVGFAASRVKTSETRILLAVVLGITSLFAAFVPANRRDLPDVYLLVTDTTRADHLSLYGYERATTPFLEEFAAEAVVFDNMVSQGSHTIVSTPCILASCYPTDHGVRHSAQVLPARLKLISEYLADRGYRTYGYATNPHLAPGLGYSQGFERYEHEPGWSHTGAGDVNARFLQWLDGVEPGPRFAFLFYIDPHNPYTPPEPFQKLFAPDWEGEPIANWDRSLRPEDHPDRVENLVAQYDGAIAYWDAELRKLVDTLRARGEFDDALIVYTSDHGEEFWEHGHWGHNRSLFEESIRVPLLVSLPVPIRLPPLPRPSGRLDTVVSSVDIVPTLLDYLWIAPDPAVRGSSVLEHVLGAVADPPRRFAYCEEILGDYGPYDVRAIRTRDSKYIRILQYEQQPGPRDLMFDLDADAGEHTDLAGSRAGGESLRLLLERAIALMARVDHPPNETIRIGPKARARLEALGYVVE